MLNIERYIRCRVILLLFLQPNKYSIHCLLHFLFMKMVLESKFYQNYSFICRNAWEVHWYCRYATILLSPLWTKTIFYL